MDGLTKAKKPIALMVLFSFMILIQAESFPLLVGMSAPPSSNYQISEVKDQPGAFEKAENNTQQTKYKKKFLGSKLFWLILGGVGFVAIMYFIMKEKENCPEVDISGTWFFDHTVTSGSYEWEDWDITFWERATGGGERSGSFEDEYGDRGEYTVDMNNHFTAEYDDFLLWKYDGTVESNDRITGTYAYVYGEWFGGTFVATRISSASASTRMKGWIAAPIAGGQVNLKKK